MKHIESAPTRRGFTLIEVLVVIAILTMLIGMFMPTVTRVRQQTRELQCRNHLRELYHLHVSYVNDYGFFPALNNDPDDGAWQYNYSIYDGRDFDENFGPLVYGDSLIKQMDLLYCPVQTDPFHSLATDVNPWPVKEGFDTRAGYGRRYHLTGKNFARLHRTRAIIADLIHLPSVIQTGHKTGVNAVYSDGHAVWVRSRRLLRKVNDLSHPFNPFEDNIIVNKVWDILDEAGHRK